MAQAKSAQLKVDQHIAEDQSDVASLLSDPATHDGQAVTRIDTHGAMVFIAGDRAYKIKRAVRYSYMNFSSLALRQLACAREVVLNRRTAPMLYLGVAPILRSKDGTMRLGALRQPDALGAGPAAEPEHPAEWAVVMRAFNQDDLFDRLAERGALDATLLTALADEIHRFHEAASRAEASYGGAQSLRVVLGDNTAEMAEQPTLFPPPALRKLAARSRSALKAVTGLLDRRLAGGMVRHCHGDLHLRNVVLLDARPCLFDAIEFNDSIACVDVLYDLAFLIMDLDQRGLRTAANLVLNRYLRIGESLDGLAALPLFLSLRAAIRAKVNAAAANSQSSDTGRREKQKEAVRYFAAAQAYLDPEPPRLVAVGGLSGSGKSTLARALASELGAAPGALHLRSDVQRKVLFEVNDLTRLPETAYTPEISAQVYQRLLDRAETALAVGHSVVLDAVYDRPDCRAAVEAVAERVGVRFDGLWLEAPSKLLLSRTAARQGDASDATPEVVRRQLEATRGTMTWSQLDAGQPETAVVTSARALIA